MASSSKDSNEIKIDVSSLLNPDDFLIHKEINPPARQPSDPNDAQTLIYQELPLHKQVCSLSKSDLGKFHGRCNLNLYLNLARACVTTPSPVMNSLVSKSRADSSKARRSPSTHTIGWKT